MRISRVRSGAVALICALVVAGHASYAVDPVKKVATTIAEPKTVTVTDRYLCKIHAHRHIKVRALDKGYLKTIAVDEGQTVKQGDFLFEIESPGEDAKADAKAPLFAVIKAPFAGIVGGFTQGQGGLVLEGETLTTLSDNSIVWGYFNVPETQYLRLMAELKKKNGEPRFELVLTNGKKFDQAGKLGAIEAQFGPHGDAIPFRVDLPNPDGLLRHGQRGVMFVSQSLTDAIAIPQHATFEQQNKRYVYVVDQDSVVHQREIDVSHELEKLFVIPSGISKGDRIVLEGIRDLHEGDKVTFVDRTVDIHEASLKKP